MVGEAVELQASVGCTTTLPSQAQREDIDIRASHEQKVQGALYTPQSAPDSKRGCHHANPRATIRHPTRSNNTATWMKPVSNTPCVPSPTCATRMHQPKHMHVLVGCKRHLMPKICHLYHLKLSLCTIPTSPTCVPTEEPSPFPCQAMSTESQSHPHDLHYFGPLPQPRPHKHKSFAHPPPPPLGHLGNSFKHISQSLIQWPAA